MIIKGERSSGAKQLADHLTRRDTNDNVIVRSIDGYPNKLLTDKDVRAALSFIEAQGKAKGKQRIFYHSVLAPQEGEILNQKQLRHAINTLAKNLGMEGHQRVVIEHHKSGRQHFHIVFNVLNPKTGKINRFGLTRRIEHETGQQLEKELGLKPIISRGRTIRRWEVQRGKRSGIDPLEVRERVTTIYRECVTGREFVARLQKVGFATTIGQGGHYVLVDRAGDIHGLIRRIEGANLRGLYEKFPDFRHVILPKLHDILKERRPILPKRAKQFRHSGAQICKGKDKSRFQPRKNTHGSKPSSKPMALLLPYLRSRPMLAASRPGDHPLAQALRLLAGEAMRPKRVRHENELTKPVFNPRSGSMTLAELIAWAWEHGRFDILMQYGFPAEMFEP